MEPRSLSSSIFRSMVFLFGTLCLGLGLAWIAGDFKHLQSNMRHTEALYVDGRKAEVKALISNLVQGIEYQIDMAEVNQTAFLRDRVHQAVSLAEHLYESNRHQMTDAQLIALIAESLRPWRYDEGRGYYFVFGTNGIEVLNADHPEMEGLDMRGIQDPEGRYVVQDMLDLVQEKPEGLYTYRWTKPGVPGADHLKASYVMLFKPLDLVIGTGQYFEDFIEVQQALILQRIRQVSFHDDGYVFVNTYDGTALVINSDTYKPGDNIWDLSDPTGLKVIQEERRAVENPDGDFIFYTWQEPGSEQSVRKISFIKGIERWQWMLGAGVYMDDLEAEIDLQRQSAKRTIGQVVLKIVFAFLAAFLLALYFTRRHTRRIKSELNNLGGVFQEAVIRRRQIDTSSLDYIEFRGFADSMNEVILERRRIEQELLKARNLESLGVLAGGIAHDFNNLLTAILGNISLAREDVPTNGSAAVFLSQAELASARARDLTGQLLTFSKGGAPRRRLEDVGGIIRESAEFSLRGTNVVLDMTLPDDLWPAEVDAGQLSQVVSNLAINAGQAMPAGGTLCVRAWNKTLAAGEDALLAAGDYLAIEFIDGGSGISAEDQARIFDPYFTTKDSGSGLGLSSVYAIIKNHDGDIRVQSQLNQGTTFQILIPANRAAQMETQAVVEGTEVFEARVLIMDDDVDVGKACALMLERLGCEVDLTENGEETLATYDRQRHLGKGYDLVLMDLTIRGGMGGQEAIGLLLERDPEAVVIVSSGYSNSPVLANFRQYGFKGMISKPYSIKELRAALAQVLTPGIDG